MSVLDCYYEMCRHYLANGDRELFASRMIGPNRALSESVVANLLSEEEEDKQALLETYYQYMKEALRVRPALLKSQKIDQFIDKAE